MKDYHINIFYSDEDGATLPTYPIWSAAPPLDILPEEALAELEKAKEAWLEAARRSGKPIPRPTGRPAIHQAIS